MVKFEVNEVVIIQSERWPEMNGIETTILEVVDHSWRNHPDGTTGYVCSVQKYSAGWWESALRKKKPPKEELSTWEAIEEEINWNPTKVKA